MKRNLIILAAIVLLGIVLWAVLRSGRGEPDTPAAQDEPSEVEGAPFSTPQITRVRRTPEKRLELHWSFPVEEEASLQSFRVMTIGEDLQYTVLSGDLPVGTRRWIDDRALSDGERLAYTVVAHGPRGDAQLSARQPVVYYDREPLPAPVNLGASTIVISGRALLEVTWDPVSSPSVAGYFVSSDHRSEGVMELAGTAARPVRENRLVLPLDNQGVRSIRVEVSASDEVGQEGRPAAIEAEVLAASLPAPADLRVSRAAGAPVTLSWGFPEGVPLRGFRLYKDGLLLLDERRLEASARQWQDPVRIDGSTYHYELEAVSAQGVVSRRAGADPFVLSLGDELPQVPAPTGFVGTWIADGGSAVVRLDWDRPVPGSRPVKGYRLEVGDGVDARFRPAANSLVGGTSYRHAPESLQKELVYRLVAIDSGGRPSEPSLAKLPRPEKLVPPPRLYNYTLLAGNDGDRLEWFWTVEPSPFITGFRFYQDGRLVMGENILGPEARSCVSEPLEPNATHRFEIEAVTATGRPAIRGPAQHYEVIE